MFKLDTEKGIGESIRQLVFPIRYEARVPESDWSPYFGKYENQRWGEWDSDSCWFLSAINCVEDQCGFLRKAGMFSAEDIKFFEDNGYIDSDGDFSFSERFGEILSGARDNGNNQMNAGIIMQEYGLIPRSMLSYTKQEADSFATREAFDADYFNAGAVSDQMRALGQESLKHINISRQWIGRAYQTPDITVLKAALKQAPLQIGIPVPDNAAVDWNQAIVQYGGKKSADHAVELYGMDDKGRYLIFDQYLPNLKILSEDYYIPFCTQMIVNPVSPAAVLPVPQDDAKDSIWTAIFNFFNGILSPNAGHAST